jgi:hypothetical protein
MNRIKVCEVIKYFNPHRFKKNQTCGCKIDLCKLDFKYINPKTKKVKIVQATLPITWK